MVLWLKVHTSTAGGEGLIPDQGTRILHASWSSQNKENRNKNSPLKIIRPEKKSNKSIGQRNPLGVQCLGLGSFPAVAWVQSLVRELRPHKLCSVAGKNIQRTNISYLRLIC